MVWWCGCQMHHIQPGQGGRVQYSGFLGHGLGPRGEGVEAVLALVLSKTGYYVASARSDFGR